MSETLFIRSVHIEDAAAISHLMLQLGYPDTAEFMVRRIEAVLTDPMAECWVAEWQNGVAGVLSVNFIPQIALAGDFARLSYFCIDELARGQSVGKKLLEKAESIARQRGCDRIEVHCHQRRVDAHRFYLREGFSESPKYFIKSLS